MAERLDSPVGAESWDWGLFLPLKPEVVVRDVSFVSHSGRQAAHDTEVANSVRHQRLGSGFGCGTAEVAHLPNQHGPEGSE